MKKILVTLAAICASFLAMAGSNVISSTSFENLVTFNTAKDDNGGDTATFWGGVAADSILSKHVGSLAVSGVVHVGRSKATAARKTGHGPSCYFRANNSGSRAWRSKVMSKSQLANL